MCTCCKKPCWPAVTIYIEGKAWTVCKKCMALGMDLGQLSLEWPEEDWGAGDDLRFENDSSEFRG